jgi:hypothetical protein
VFWTNDEFAKHGVGFKFYVRDFTKDTKTRRDIFIQILEYKDLTFNVEEFCACKHIIYDVFFIGCELTYDQISFLEDLEYKDVFNEGEIKISKTWAEVIDNLIKTKVIETYDENDYWDEFKKDLKILEIDIEKKPKYKKIHETYGYGRSDIYHILKVIERRIEGKNYRLAITGYPRYEDGSYKFRVVSEDEVDYTRVDEGKLHFRKGNKYFYLDENTNEYDGERLLINDDLFRLMEQNIDHVLNEEQNLITPMIYSFYKETLHFPEQSLF